MAFRSRRSSFARNLKALDPEYVDYEMDGGCSAAEKNQWFFEVGWEVANKGEPATSRSFGITYLWTINAHTFIRPR